MFLKIQVWMIVNALGAQRAVAERSDGDKERGAVTVEQIVIAALLAGMAILVIGIVSVRIQNKASTMTID